MYYRVPFNCCNYDTLYLSISPCCFYLATKNIFLFWLLHRNFYDSLFFTSISAIADNKHSKINFIIFHVRISFIVFCHKIIITNTTITSISIAYIPHITFFLLLSLFYFNAIFRKSYFIS